MEATLDKFGRIVIPKKVRENFNLGPGTQIHIEETNDMIVLKPIHREPNLIKKNGVLVFSGTSTGNIEEALIKHRAKRLNIIGGKLEGIV